MKEMVSRLLLLSASLSLRCIPDPFYFHFVTSHHPLPPSIHAPNSSFVELNSIHPHELATPPVYPIIYIFRPSSYTVTVFSCYVGNYDYSPTHLPARPSPLDWAGLGWALSVCFVSASGRRYLVDAGSSGSYIVFSRHQVNSSTANFVQIINAKAGPLNEVAYHSFCG
ncbi:hypothetical protein BDN70DRAFT_971663 [Pholiota conissans]|uniref:Peptidase A1 domain-containing protein n=1 Tax=Pholiota conissans TaxID=109636 RepID=A0A9P5Z5E5_9AGAR|nr:hypothetical protein BDN70DRAFT_971663 [Pholiota conissans]